MGGGEGTGKAGAVSGNGLGSGYSEASRGCATAGGADITGTAGVG